jgi:hypothetical protein
VNRNLIVGLVVVVLCGALGYWLANNTHWEGEELPGRLGETLSPTRSTPFNTCPSHSARTPRYAGRSCVCLRPRV